MKTALKLSVFFNVLLILGIATFCYKAYYIKEVDKNEKEINIVLFGDSIIDDGDWSTLLNRDDVKTRGFRGFTTSQYRWIIKDSVLIYKPKICFISGGINDIGSGIPLERTIVNYKSLLDTLLSNNVIPVVQSTLYQENNPISKIMVDSLNAFLVNYTKLKNIHYLDVNSKLSSGSGLKPEFSKDGTHLKENAYVIWKNEILSILKTLSDKNYI